jgi:hypothetical protein
LDRPVDANEPSLRWSARERQVRAVGRVLLIDPPQASRLAGALNRTSVDYGSAGRRREAEGPLSASLLRATTKDEENIIAIPTRPNSTD